jgi:hypothetical protein
MITVVIVYGGSTVARFDRLTAQRTRHSGAATHGCQAVFYSLANDDRVPGASLSACSVEPRHS